MHTRDRLGTAESLGQTMDNATGDFGRAGNSRVHPLDTAFVARTPELTRAIPILDSVGTNGAEGRVLFLVGEPGIAHRCETTSTHGRQR